MDKLLRNAVRVAAAFALLAVGVLACRWAEMAGDATATLRETRAVIGEAHATLALIREQADAQAGYIEATTRRSADIAQRTQLALKHLDELIVAGRGAVGETTQTIAEIRSGAAEASRQTSEAVALIRSDMRRAVDAVEEAGQGIAFAGQEAGLAARTTNAAVQALAPGAGAVIGDALATMERVQDRINDPRVDESLASLTAATAAMPALVADARTGVQETTKTVRCARRGIVRWVLGCGGDAR